MNPIFKAMASGYGAQQILGFITKSFPSLNPKIQKAMLGGYSAQKILDFLSKSSGGKPVPEDLTQNQIIGQRSNDDAETVKQLLRSGGTALGALGAYGLGKLSSPSSQSNPTSNPQTPSPNIPVNSQGMNPTAPPITNPSQPIQPPQQVIQSAKQPGINPVPNVPNVPTNQVPTTNLSNNSLVPTAQVNPPIIDPIQAEKYLKDKGVLDQVKNLIQKNTPEEITAVLDAQSKPGRLRAKEDPELLMNIKAFQEAKKSNGQNELPGQVRSPRTEGTTPELLNGNPGEETTETVEAKKPKAQERGNVVSLPNGEIGTIEDLKKDHAVVEVDGKKKPVKLDQIEALPISQKDLADLHDELIQGMQKETGQDVSRNVMWAGYDPEKNQLKYLPWDGDLYTYEDIPPEMVERLTNLLTQRKSSGKNFIGPWVAGTKSPIGAAMYQIIKELQAERGGKGKEYSGKAKPIYNAYEPSIKASKEKKKKEDEEKRRQKERR
jgi:hypothetical protein